MRTHLFVLFLLVAAAACLSCTDLPAVGDEGQPCSDKGKCRKGLECGQDRVCNKPGAVHEPDAGGADAATDAATLPDVADAGGDGGSLDAADAATDGAEAADAPDAGGDALPAGDASEDVGDAADSGLEDSGCIANCVGKKCTDDDGCGSKCNTWCPVDDMVNVPAGSFMMGCNESVDSECSEREKPYHSVDVPQFQIDRFEVTVAEYQGCINATYCTEPKPGDSQCNWGVAGRQLHPTNCVDWNQAGVFCDWTGKRLPSEAEWEKAARGNDGRKYPWGNEPAVSCDNAVVNDTAAGGQGCGTQHTMPVGSKPAGASPFGALDMLGNVGEWVEDDGHADYQGAPTDGSPWTDTPRGIGRITRGGSYQVTAPRVSDRIGFGKTNAMDPVGFRCAK
jgi:formylglycine-generating enzyme required for sulfatase activity